LKVLIDETYSWVWFLVFRCRGKGLDPSRQHDAVLLRQGGGRIPASGLKPVSRPAGFGVSGMCKRSQSNAECKLIKRPARSVPEFVRGVLKIVRPLSVRF
jgi:hypothetical protein